MTSIRENENELFKRWQRERGYAYFVKDGVFCPERWRQEPVKITFVLKEANWPGEDGDLREHLIKGQSSTYWKTWNNVARWSQALLSGGEYPRRVSREDKTAWLSRVSFLNLKKVGGGKAAQNREIRDFVRRDAPFILEQLNLYQPDIIICGGRGEGKNADLLREFVLPPEGLSEWQKPLDIFNYYYTTFASKARPTPVISFFHPQKIAGHAVYESWYNTLVGIAKELL